MRMNDATTLIVSPGRVRRRKRRATRRTRSAIHVMTCRSLEKLSIDGMHYISQNSQVRDRMYPKDPKTAQNLMKPLDVVIGRGGFPTGSWNFASLSFLTHVALSQEVFEHVSRILLWTWWNRVETHRWRFQLTWAHFEYQQCVGCCLCWFVGDKLSWCCTSVVEKGWF